MKPKFYMQPCSKDWNKMQANKNGVFCGFCKKQVYDLTNKSEVERNEIFVQNNGKICAKLHKNEVIIASSKWHTFKKMVASLVFLLVFGIAKAQTNENEEIERPPMKSEVKALELEDDINYCFPEPSLICGKENLRKTIKKQLKHYRPQKEGIVKVSFLADVWGVLSEFKIEKSLSLAEDEKAIKVIQSLGKMWIPGRKGIRASAIVTFKK